jgi:8-oxo-dGTP pyrophosphatase MutT (NUDIX family)
MADLQPFKARICYTAAGYLVHEGKVLFVKHKKLGIWLAPGGHVEAEELPHAAAEREVWEETGIKVRAVNFETKLPLSADSEFVPNPVFSNLHWVSEANYQSRLASNHPEERYATKLWPKGCEQHIGFVYLVEPIDGVEFQQNLEESDGIGWFSLEELAKLQTASNIRFEAEWILRHHPSMAV